MALTNKISIVINQEAKTKIETAVDTIFDNLPKLITLSNEERIELPKMGDKTVSFVNKSLEYARQNPGIVPAYLDLTEFGKDVDAVNALFQILAPVKKLTEGLDDTMLLAGSEAYMASLVFYTALKGAINAGQTGLKHIYDDLSARFPGRPAGKAKSSNEKA
jgi:hypothetical protein